MVVLLNYVPYWLTALTSPDHRSLLLITATLLLLCSLLLILAAMFTILYTEQSTMIGCLLLCSILLWCLTPGPELTHIHYCDMFILNISTPSPAEESS